MLIIQGFQFLAVVASGVYLAAALVLLAGLGVYVFLRVRGAASKPDRESALAGIADAVSTEDSNDRSRTATKRSSTFPTKAELAHSASSDASNFSKNYAESLEINHLPIGRITTITAASPFEELEDSDDEGLLAAIDEVQDDSDVDSEFRLIALRVLAGFRARNAVEELSQIALYDLSSTLRAKAVMMLADFDHESVFEAIVLACADPSREVRAAGAKALVKVTFDRANAWTRFATSDDQYLSRQVARAAVEAGIVERSFDRLVLSDEKAVHEAFALFYLLIKTGETDKMFDAIRDHRDVKTRVALLHVIKLANVAEVIPSLTAFIAAEPMGSVVADKAREALLAINAIPVGA
jgi:HEAT repeat protein